MKTNKKISATILGLLFSTMIFAMSNTIHKTDTIRIKTEDDTELVIVIPISELKKMQLAMETIMEKTPGLFDEKFVNKFKPFDTIYNISTIYNVSIDDIGFKTIIEGERKGERHIIETDSQKSKRKSKSLYGFTKFSLGLNNYLENGNTFPNDNKEQYSVKAWGSWDVAIGGGMRWYVAKPISFDITADVSWYNFKFQDKATRIDIDNNQIVFLKDSMGYDYKKSKITVPYVNASIIPMVHFGKSSRGLNRNMFRLGAGAYAGYRLGGKVKYVYKDSNSKNTFKDKDDFYLNSYRYGVKAVFGINEINIYAAYDLNTLFAENKAPELNPISFGINWNF